MFRSKTPKDAILHRLKIARGHLDMIIKQVEKDAYCVDILTQSRAVQSALRQTDNAILEQHLNTCVVKHIQQGRAKKAIDEILTIFRKR